MRIYRDVGIRQVTAWFLMQRIRECFTEGGDKVLFPGPVEANETYVGGKRKNMSNAKRKELAEAGAGRGTVGKTAVVGVKDRKTRQVRARVVESTDKPTLQGFVRDNAEPGATLYTDEHGSYAGMPEYDHEAVNHSVSEYVRGLAHTNGMEAHWSLFKRFYHGTFHKLSAKHLQRYTDEFAGRNNIRDMDTLDQMAAKARRFDGRRLTYADLIADNGLPSGARPTV